MHSTSHLPFCPHLFRSNIILAKKVFCVKNYDSFSNAQPPHGKFITQLEGLKACDKSTLYMTVYEKLIMFHFDVLKIMYKIILGSNSISQYVCDIVSHLYLCIWHYYKEKFVI